MAPPIDLDLLAFVNRPGIAWLDAVMVALSSRLLLLPLAVASAVYLWRKSAYGPLAAVLFGLAIGASDLTAVRLVKPAAARVRPCRASPETVVAIDGCGSGASFPSAHAANAAAGAVVLAWGAPAVGAAAALFALLVGVSRVYLGVHWPTDVLAGWALGAAVATLLLFVARLRHSVSGG